MRQPYQTIDEFFDAFSLPHALSMLANLVKTAASYKAWKGACPANAIYFTERLKLLTEAVFSIQEQYELRNEIVLDKSNTEMLWMLGQYETYCGWHRASTPWHFFPRHLSQKEFINPYKALKKFAKKHSLKEWKEILKELCFHSLSPHSIDDFDDNTNIIDIWLHLHKMIEAVHLIEVRTIADEPKPRRKWKNENQIEKQSTEPPNQQAAQCPPLAGEAVQS